MFASVIGYSQLSQDEQSAVWRKVVFGLPGPPGLLGSMVASDFERVFSPTPKPSPSSTSSGWDRTSIPPKETQTGTKDSCGGIFGLAAVVVAIVLLGSLLNNENGQRSATHFDDAFTLVLNASLHRPSLLAVVDVDGATIFPCTTTLCGLGTRLPIGTKVRISGDAGDNWVFVQASLDRGEVNGVMKKPYLPLKSLYGMTNATSQGDRMISAKVASAN